MTEHEQNKQVIEATSKTTRIETNKPEQEVVDYTAKIKKDLKKIRASHQ